MFAAQKREKKLLANSLRPFSLFVYRRTKNFYFLGVFYSCSPRKSKFHHIAITVFISGTWDERNETELENSPCKSLFQNLDERVNTAGQHFCNFIMVSKEKNRKRNQFYVIEIAFGLFDKILKEDTIHLAMGKVTFNVGVKNFVYLKQSLLNISNRSDIIKLLEQQEDDSASLHLLINLLITVCEICFLDNFPSLNKKNGMLL